LCSQRAAEQGCVSYDYCHPSTPRKAGTKMLIYPDGRIVGAIGGGCTESEARLETLRALDENTSFTYLLSLLDDAVAAEGMVCGGTMEIFLQVI